MKYIDVKTVVNSYLGFQNCMTNKSWGFLALLKGCKSKIHPIFPYEVNLDEVSNFLEDIFNLSQSKRLYEGGKSLYVVFSNKWDNYFKDQGRYSPNIYDVAVWAYRRREFSDETTKEDIIKMFASEFNIPIELIANSFNIQTKDISFSQSLYSESLLKTELGKIGVDVSSDNIDAKKCGVVASPGEISRGPFVQTLYAGLDITDYVIILQSNFMSLYGGTHKSDMMDEEKCKFSLQQIFYGAPGTGKSNKIKEEVDNLGRIHFRTTFHPDSDYSTFVGCYKPKSHKKNMLNGNGINETQLLSSFFDSNSPKYNRMNKARYLYEALVHTKDIRDLGLDAQTVADKLNAKGFSGCAYTTEATCMYNIYDWLKEDGYIVENKITYEFTPQAFLKAYTEAWMHQATGDPVYLIIEEINRGNCAQIFGDIFQLLDRDEQGFSRYEISPDSDIQDYIGSLGLNISGIVNSEGKDVSAEIASGEILKLPDNLYIWATMNTSDQSLFPIDSAFKRRWEWKYIKIKEGKDENGNKLDWKIDVKIDEEGNLLPWWEFIQKINEIIASMTSSADKQLGYFFCKADKGGKISAETFVSKVIFYLWNDVFKDYGFEDASLFRYTNKEGTECDLTFPDFYDEDGEKVDADRLTDFLKKVMDWKADGKKDNA